MMRYAQMPILNLIGQKSVPNIDAIWEFAKHEEISSIIYYNFDHYSDTRFHTTSILYCGAYTAPCCFRTLLVTKYIMSECMYTIFVWPLFGLSPSNPDYISNSLTLPRQFKHFRVILIFLLIKISVNSVAFELFAS